MTWLETLTWPEAEARLKAGAHVLVPIGARSKEHGHHLPMQTDYLLARALCDGVAARLAVLIAPVIDFGYYPAFADYPGSQHLSAQVFIAMVEEILEALLRQGARTISIVNTGVSTEGPLQIVVRNIQARLGRIIAIADIRRLGTSSDHLLQQETGGHGDEHETSLILAIAPDTVRPGLAVPDYGHLREEPKTVFYRPTRFSGDPASGANYSKTGVRGDPTLATAEKGHAILAAMVDDLVDGLIKLDPEIRCIAHF